MCFCVSQGSNFSMQSIFSTSKHSQNNVEGWKNHKFYPSDLNSSAPFEYLL